ncbi:MAG: aminotransferase class III-fold pyridoxal phosphate-dependent enzyme [Gemmatimonadota bacterium]|nr:aminotransferase class III-fold pyridoxal phosphate-dependent enzyme [Gemmatimonadota bacterium]
MRLLTLEEALDWSAVDYLEAYRRHVNPGLHRIYRSLGMNELDVVRAQGTKLHLRGGRVITDFTSAGGILNLGHNHPRIVAAERLCLDNQVVDALKIAPHRLQAALAENLARLLPGPLGTAFFAVSGAEANEAAMKLCERAQPGRTRFITTEGGYHGKTHGALSVTRSEDFADGFLVGLPADAVTTVPYGNAGAVETALMGGDGEVIAMILEPVQGQGLLVPPAGYVADVVRICHDHGALVIADEVKVGLGRLGSLFGFQRDGAVPDVVTISKALGGGRRAMAAMVTSEELFVRAYGVGRKAALHSTTFGGLGASCAIAIEALNVIVDDRLSERAAELGAFVREQLDELAARHGSIVRGIRGVGLFQGIHFDFTPVSSALRKRKQLAALKGSLDSLCMVAIVRALVDDHDIVAGFSSSDPDILQVLPPLVVTRDELAAFVDAMDVILTRGLRKVVADFAVKNLKELM